MSMLRHRRAVGERRAGAPALLVAHARRRHLPRRARRAAAGRRGRPHADARRSRRAGTATRGGSTTSCCARSRGRRRSARCVYVCGPTRFVEAVADGLVRARLRPALGQDRALRSDGTSDGAAPRRQRDRRAAARALRRRADRRAGVCGTCGAREEMARLDVYVDCPGVVVRCRHCANVMITIVRGRSRTWVDLGGTRGLEL